MADGMTKMTVTVDSVDYNAVVGGLHYGQLAQFTRKLFADLSIMLKDPAQQDCLVDYVYRKKPLIVGGKPNGKINQAVDGKD